MSLKIRRARFEDAGIIVEFNRRLAVETEGKTLDLELLNRGVKALLEDDAKGFYTLAERNGEVVGQTLITLEWSDWRNGWFWWIQSVYVREDARSNGIFKAIFKALKEEARQDPQTIGLRLYVEHNNQHAQSIYRKLGMSDTAYGILELYPLQ